jgi:hypothetical protein
MVVSVCVSTLCVHWSPRSHSGPAEWDRKEQRVELGGGGMLDCWPERC